jgi:hypothetical protein
MKKKDEKVKKKDKKRKHREVRGEMKGGLAAEPEPLH